MNFAFSAKQRIRQSYEFERAFRQPALTNKWFTVYIFDNKQEYARLGMVISKRIIPRAVGRNLAKRLIRELFRNNVTTLPKLDFVVRLRRNLKNDNCVEAKTALLNLMRDARTP